MQQGKSAPGTQLPRRHVDLGLGDRFLLLPTWTPYMLFFGFFAFVFFFKKTIQVLPRGLARWRERGNAGEEAGIKNIPVHLSISLFL